MSDNTPLIQGAVAMSTIATILLIFVIVGTLNPGLVDQLKSSRMTGPSVGMNLFIGIIGSIAPDISILSGFVGDIVAGKFRYSVTSFAALAAVILNKLVWGLGGGDDLASIASGLASAAAPASGPGAAAVSVAASTAAPAAAAPAAAPAAPAAAAAAALPPIIPTSIFNSIGFASGTSSAPAPAFSNPGASAPAQRAPKRRAGPASVVSSLDLGAGSGLADVFTTGRSLPSPPLRPAQRTTARNLGVRRSVVETQSGRLSRPNLGVSFAPGRGSPQAGGARLPEYFKTYNPCTIRGMGALDTQKSPMGVVALSTIFMVYFLDMTVNSKRSQAEVTLNVFFGFGVLALNCMAYSLFGCYGDTLTERALPIAKALLIGSIVGASTFGIFNTIQRANQYLPLDPSPASISSESQSGDLGPGGTQQCPSGYTSVNGKCKKIKDTDTSAKCSGPDANNEFVCDAYRNGKKVST